MRTRGDIRSARLGGMPTWERLAHTGARAASRFHWWQRAARSLFTPRLPGEGTPRCFRGGRLRHELHRPSAHRFTANQRI